MKKNRRGNPEKIGEIEDIPYQLLLDAVREKGSINSEGQYPINKEMENWIKKSL